MDLKVKKSDYLYFLVAVFFGSFIISTKVFATEEFTGNDMIKEVEMTTQAEEVFSELVLGTVGKLKYTFVIPKDVSMHKGDKIVVKFPDEIESIYNEELPIMDGKKQVATISPLNMGEEEFTIIIDENIVSGKEITTDYITFLFKEETSIEKITLNFGNNVQKEVTLLPPMTGIGDFFEVEENLKNRAQQSWDDIGGFELTSTPIGNYFYGRLQIATIKALHPNYKANLADYVYPYYFFAQDEEGKFIDGLIARCLDMNHSISKYEVAYSSNLEEYIYEEGVEKIILNTQTSFMLAEEKGFFLSTDNGKHHPLNFSPNGTEEGYEQRAYLFASQIMGWIDALKYSKIDELRLDKLEYSHINTYSRLNTGHSFSRTDMTSYTQDIEERTEMYKDISYLQKDTLNFNQSQPQITIEIPEEQRIFKHYIDEENSENLHLINGISESDFESFESLTLTPTKEFNGETVKLAFKKTFYGATDIAYSGSGMNSVQYRHIIGMTDNYIKAGDILLKSSPMTDISVKKVWEDNENQDGKRPESIQVQLYANDDMSGEEVTLSASNEWSNTWLNLDKKDELDQEIIYTVQEVTELEEYEVEISQEDEHTIIIRNIYDSELTEISGEKIWNDNENQDGKRPEAITVRLFANNEEVSSQIVNESTDWRYMFESLPKMKNGQEINYRVEEDTVPEYSTTIEGTTIINSYTPGQKSFSVQKIWEDNNNQDGKRPESIQVQLYANESAYGEEITLDKSNDWKYTWTELAIYDNKQEIVYTVEEVTNVESYVTTTTQDDEYNVTITNSYTPELTEISGEKIWDDKDNQAGIRPESIIVRLLADQKEIASEIVNEGTGWSYIFSSLPKMKDGEEINYTVIEDPVPEYTTEIDGTTIINHFTPGEIDVNVRKIWEDNNNQDGLRPSSIQVQLYANDIAYGNRITLSESNEWMYTWSNLYEKDADDQKINYTVKEVTNVRDYEMSVSQENEYTFAITNTYAPELVEVSGEKVWDDSHDQDGKRPESIIVRLLANQEEVDSKIVTEEDRWYYSFESLPKMKNGKRINYTVIEDVVPEYLTRIQGTTIVNSYTPDKTSVNVRKIWEDNNNQDGIRPESIQVQLYADGVAYEEPITLNESNKWSHTWRSLDLNDEGKEIVYTVKEVSAVDPYTTKITQNGKNTNVITNTYVPEFTEISGEKIWNDNNNQDSRRPESIVVRLLADGEEFKTQTVTADMNWNYTFESLPKMKDGQEINYTVIEDPVPGYSTEIEGTTIINNYTPDETGITVKKVWEDNNNQEKLRPESIQVQLYANEVAEGEKITLKDSNQWTHTWTNLAEKDTNNQVIDYTVKEVTEVEHYENLVTKTNDHTIIITNTYVPELTEVPVEKIWEDDGNSANKRPESIFVRLLANGEEFATQKVTADMDWSYTFESLPKMKDGEEINYTVTEDIVPEYSTEIEGTTIKNTYTPGKTSVNVKKIWEDNNNQDGLRPKSIKVQLYANGDAYGKEIKLNEENDWTHTWTELDIETNNQLVDYTVEEVTEVDQYETMVTKDNDYTITIINTYVPELTEVPVDKVWEDNENSDNKRPESIFVRLLANEEEFATQEVTADMNWSYTFESLPKMKDGKEIKYTVTEDIVSEYSTEIKGTTIKNTYTPGKTSVNVKKIWEDNNDLLNFRPQKIYVQLYADGEAYGKKVKLNEKNNWTHTWDDLDISKDGQNIKYTVEEETQVDGYVTTIDNEDITNIIITNTYTDTLPKEDECEDDPNGDGNVNNGTGNETDDPCAPLPKEDECEDDPNGNGNVNNGTGNETDDPCAPLPKEDECIDDSTGNGNVNNGTGNATNNEKCSKNESIVLPATGESINKWYILAGGLLFILFGMKIVMKLRNIDSI